MSEARYVRAKAYISLKQEIKALADLNELSKDTRTIHGEEAKYLLAQLYYDNKDDKNAETVLMNFIENGRLAVISFARIHARKVFPDPLHFE